MRGRWRQEYYMINGCNKVKRKLQQDDCPINYAILYKVLGNDK